MDEEVVERRNALYGHSTSRAVREPSPEGPMERLRAMQHREAAELGQHHRQEMENLHLHHVRPGRRDRDGKDSGRRDEEQRLKLLGKQGSEKAALAAAHRAALGCLDY